MKGKIPIPSIKTGSHIDEHACGRILMFYILLEIEIDFAEDMCNNMKLHFRILGKLFECRLYITCAPS